MHLGTFLHDNFTPRTVDYDAPATPHVRNETNDFKACNLICCDHPNIADSHMPVIDLDFPAVLLDSTRSGKHHLLIHKPMTTAQMDKLLSVLHEVGLYDEGNLKAFRRNGYVGIRPPWIAKQPYQGESAETLDGIPTTEAT